MRGVLVALCLGAALEAVLTAQLPQIPRRASELLGRLPTLDSLTRGTPPLTTGFNDALGPVPLPIGNSWRTAHNMTELARTPEGAFVLRPGLWELTVDSYCLTDASYTPGSGDGYLYAPLKGSRQDVIQTILRGVGRHPELQQGQVQVLLWSILARSKISALSPNLRAVARTLLSTNQISGIDSNALDLIPLSERSRLLSRLPAPARKTIEAEADLRDRLVRASSSYAEIERIAVVTGAAPKVTGPHVDRGQWARSPGGYLIRYFPSSYSKTRVQVLLPERSRVRRDALNRIISITDDHGGRTETEYDDSIRPATTPRLPTLKAYAFKLIRIVTPQPSGAPLVHEIRNKGWTFVHVKPAGRAAADPAPIFGWPLAFEARLAAQEGEGRFGDMGARVEQAQEINDRINTYQDVYHGLHDPPTRDSVDELGDTEHYRDGVNAAVRGEYGEQLDWIRDNQQRQNAALEYGTSVIGSLPGSSTTGDLPTGTWDPGGGTAVAAGGGRQRLGMSGRGH